MLRQRRRPRVTIGGRYMAVEIRASAFQTAQRRFDAAADVIGLSDDARKSLREVKRELTVHFPVHMDDGSVRVFTGWRGPHHISPGPAQGGIPYRPRRGPDPVHGLAPLLSREVAPLGLPPRWPEGAAAAGPPHH